LNYESVLASVPVHDPHTVAVADGATQLHEHTTRLVFFQMSTPVNVHQ